MKPDDIDIHALPIPDFGLTCPGCDYALVGLPEHRCPECGLALDMADLIQPYHMLRDPEITGAERPLPDFGLRCRACAQPLAGAPDDACPACDAPFDLDDFRPRRDWVTVFSHFDAVRGAMARLVLQENLVPHLTGDDEIRKIFGAVGIARLGPRIDVPRSFFFEAKHLLTREVARIEAAHADLAPHTDRPCPHCGETNPANFEVCWSCNTNLAPP